MYRFNKDKKKKDYSRLIDLIIGFLRENDHRPLKNYIKRPQFVIEIFLRLFQAEKKNWRYRQSDRTPDVNCTSVNSVGISTKSNKKKFTLPSSYRLLYSVSQRNCCFEKISPSLLDRREWSMIYEKMKKKKKRKIKGKK